MNWKELIRPVAIALAASSATGCSGDDELEIQVLYSRKITGGQASFEMISSDDRLTEIIEGLGTTDFGGPNPADGSVWHPEVDFEEHVVAFASVVFTCSADVKEIRAVETDQQVKLEVTSRTPGCDGVLLSCSSYAFVEMPLLKKQYVLRTKDASPKCN